MDINDKWRDFSRGERPEGVCEDQSAFMNGIFTSVGIPSLTQNAYWHIKDDGGMGHAAYLFFDGEKWKGTELQWDTFKKYGIEKGGADRFNLNIYIPPWNQKGHLTNWRCELGKGYVPPTKAFYMEEMTPDELKDILLQGVTTSEMRKWLGLD